MKNMDNLKLKIKTILFFILTYVVLLISIPYKLFILTGITVLVYNINRLFKRKHFIVKYYEMYDKADKAFSLKNKEDALDLLKPFYTPLVIAFFGLIFLLMGFLTNSGLLCFMVIIIGFFASKFTQDRPEFLNPPREFSNNEMLEKCWDEESFKDQKKNIENFFHMTQRSRWNRTSFIGIVYLSVILLNEIHFHANTWSWIGL